MQALPDGWATVLGERGRDYGTILIDVETGRPVDLLRDREAGTVADWLKEHPPPRRLVSCCSLVS